MKEVLLEVHTALCRKYNADYILALSEDQNVVSIRDKNPIKVNLRQSKTFVRTAITPKAIGIHHYNIHILNPIDHKIITRYTVKI